MIDIHELRPAVEAAWLNAISTQEVLELLDRLEAAEKERGVLRGRLALESQENGALRDSVDRACEERDALRKRRNQMSTEFTREERYIVFKLSDVERYLTAADRSHLAMMKNEIDAGRDCANKPPFKGLIVESDWPEYEPTWRAIEARVTGAQAQPAPNFADAYQGAMEEVAIWKKRALEAEALNRKFIAEINGPVHMGEPVQNVPTALLVAVANLVAQMEIVSRVGFVDTPNDRDSCAGFCVAEGTWLELMSAVESLAATLTASVPEGE